MKVLVTGGAGFIGSHVCERLLARGDTVVCVDDFNDYYDPARKRANIRAAQKNPRFALRKADIRSASQMRAAMRTKPEAIIHLAARAGVRPSILDPELYADVNVAGTANLLACAKGVKRFIFGSSSSVYGENSSVPFRESDPLENSQSPYAATKRMGELWVRQIAGLRQMRSMALRFFTVYGPRNRPDMAVAKYIAAVKANLPLTMYGDGTTSRDYTYVDDIATGIVSALDKCGEYEEVNLGRGEPVLLRELVSTIEKETGKKARIQHQPMQQGDVPRTWADISKARRLLGYRPRISIQEGIRRYVRWLEDGA